MGGAEGSAAPTRSPLAEWLLRNRMRSSARVPTTGPSDNATTGEGPPSSLKLDAAMRLLRVGGARDDSASPGAAPVGHVVRRVQPTAKEQREEAALLADRAERERIRRVVAEADEAETAERRRLRDQARLVHRAAKTARMIETHEATEVRRAERAAARAREETLATWHLEEEAFLAQARDADRARRRAGTRAETETETETGDPLPTVAEARLHRRYVAREAFASSGRCRLCDAGRYHGESECELTRRLRAPDEEDPRTAWRPRGAETGADPKHAVRAAAKLLHECETRREVEAWFERTPREAKAATTELSLSRRGLAKLPDVTHFHGVTTLKLTRNRITNLPDDFGDVLPCLETLEASCNLLASLPESAGRLMFLRRLEISGNALRTLPSLAGARSLRRLDASSNRLESLPDDLAHCAELAELVVNANPSLEALPADLGLFQPSLRGVWARGCGLTTLSRGLEAAAGLVDLDVGANRLRELPDALGGAQQPKLRSLRAAENALRRLPSGLAGALVLETLDASHNALVEIDVLAKCASLVELRVGDNDIATLPRDLAGGPARLKLALQVGRERSGLGETRAETGGTSRRWSGLRVLLAERNRLRKIPSDLGATLVASGAAVVDFAGNPLEPDLLRRLDAVGAAGLMSHLADVHDALELAPREFETRTRTKTSPSSSATSSSITSASLARLGRSREAPPSLGGGVATGALSGADVGRAMRSALEATRDPEAAAAAAARHARARESARLDIPARPRRRHSLAETPASSSTRAAVFASHEAFARRVGEIDELFSLRTEARKAAAAARARTRWGAAILSKMRGGRDPKEAAAGLAKRDALLAAVSAAAEKKRQADEAEFRWIHDVDAFRVVPFRLRCELARKCRRHRVSRGEVVYSRGEDADHAVIVVEGRCQIRVPEDEAPGETGGERPQTRSKQKSSTSSSSFARDDARETTTAIGEVVSGALRLAEAEEALTRRARGRGGPGGPGGRGGEGSNVSGSNVSEGSNVSVSDVSESDVASLRAKRHGADACVGLECLLTGAPRAHTLVAKSPETCVMEVPRDALAAALAEDDASRARDHAAKRRRAAAEARRAARSADANAADESVADAETAALDAHDARLLENPPEMSARESLFRAETLRRLRGVFDGAFDALPEEERDAAFASTLFRVKAAANGVGLGLPEGLYDAHDEATFPWTRPWGARARASPPELLGTGPEGTPTLDPAGLTLCRRLGACRWFRALTAAEIRHVVAAGARVVVAAQGRDETPLALENDPEETGAAYVILEGRADAFRATPNRRRVAKLKPGDVACELALLTGAKPDATVAASASRKAPPKVRAIEIPKKALRAVVERRPTALDDLAERYARDVARRRFGATRDDAEEDVEENGREERIVREGKNATEARGREDDASPSPAPNGTDGSVPRAGSLATMTFRLARRAAESAASHFCVGTSAWTRVGETVLANVRRRRLERALAAGGLAAFLAAAAGAAGAADDDAEIVEKVRADGVVKRRRKVRGARERDFPTILAASPAFRSLTAAEIRAVLARGARRVRVPAGEVFLQQGYPGAAAYVVLGGAFEALVKRPGASGDAGGGELATTATYARGDSFGEASLLVGARRDASLRATADAWVLEVHRRGLETVAARRPAVADELARFLARRGTNKNADGEDAEDDEDGEGLDAREWTRTTPADHDRSVESVFRWIARGERSSSRSRGGGASGGGAASEDGVLRSRLAFGESSRVALDVLSRLDVFASLDRTQMLVMLREGARVETHPPGSVVATRGDEGDAMYAILEGEAESRDDRDETPESESSSRRILTRGDAFGESCLLAGAPRRETVVATYRGATLVEIRAAAVAPMLRNAKFFIRAAAAAVAAKEDQTATNEEPSTEASREHRAEIRAARVAASIRAFYGLPRDDDDDYVASDGDDRLGAARAGLPTRGDDPTPFPGGFGARSDAAGSAPASGLGPGKPRKRRLGTDPRDASLSASPLDDAWTARLRAHPLFGAMTACELAHLRASARRVFVPVGRRLVGEGDDRDDRDDAFLVVAGVLNAYAEKDLAGGGFRRGGGDDDDDLGSGAGRRTSTMAPARVKVGELGPGFVCGAARAVRPGGRRRVTSVVATPPGAEAIAVSGEALRRVLGERPMLENVVDDLEADGTLDVDDGFLARE